MYGFVDVLDLSAYIEVVLIGLFEGPSLIIVVKKPRIFIENITSDSKNIVKGLSTRISSFE